MISDQSVYGYLPIQEQRKVLTCPRLLPNNSHQVLLLDIKLNNFDDSQIKINVNVFLQVAKYNKKVFCGTHARNGDIFITACPDKIRLYDTRKGSFKLANTIEVKIISLSLKVQIIYNSTTYIYKMFLLQPRDVGWSILDVAVSQVE